MEACNTEHGMVSSNGATSLRDGFGAFAVCVVPVPALDGTLLFDAAAGAVAVTFDPLAGAVVVCIHHTPMPMPTTATTATSSSTVFFMEDLAGAVSPGLGTPSPTISVPSLVK